MAAITTATPSYISTRPITCILHALNNYLGRDHYTTNPTSRPRTFAHFHELFITVAPPSIATFLVIPSHVFHTLTLAGAPLPAHIFAIRGTHIYNYSRAPDNKWWRIDSTAGTAKLIHIPELGLGDNILVLPLTAAEAYSAKLAIIKWAPLKDSGRGYYDDIKTKLLEQL